MEGCKSVVVGDGGEAALSCSKLEPSLQDDDCWEESTLRDEPTLATERTRNKPTPRRGPVRDMVQQFSCQEAPLNVECAGPLAQYENTKRARDDFADDYLYPSNP
jgi:hypothetical protein